MPYQLNERVKQMGCRWDPDARSWYHSDAAVAEQAQRLVQEHREKTQEPRLNQSKVDLSRSADLDHGM